MGCSEVDPAWEPKHASQHHTHSQTPQQPADVPGHGSWPACWSLTGCICLGSICQVSGLLNAIILLYDGEAQW